MPALRILEPLSVFFFSFCMDFLILSPLFWVVFTACFFFFCFSDMQAPKHPEMLHLKGQKLRFRSGIPG